ncbi:metalloprotease 1 [Nannizzia gypsea CBS 118893]|uniref:Extracellular metalloprotease MGYG_00389 n=1 Tax=Arthroderma gypseum (strain ATCC MYA-4604 / CBS 118893) TaxID=535722 RepID=MEP7_ARTGP|nr:metalloprotease 1 [Nannizzia gypsea CBS 118893]E5QZI4.1 RecName: Full=Extracellular metalloprotease MGYG_00389; Flags: Precursor [Nannizzia gypsea CBS 118893]EFQ97350.1 metalloprotease 1 [Nannizzia gypsea CBS 118893]
MRFSVFLPAIAALSSAVAAQRSCGSIPHKAFSNELKEAMENSRTSSFSNVTSNVTINTYFHVITDGNTGKISDETLQKQIAVLNSDYKASGFSFKLVASDSVDNPTWAAGEDDMGMKSALRKGGYDTLNVYFVPMLREGLLGFCYFPMKNPSEGQKIKDGCVINSNSVPGGSAQNYNEGKTTTHEVGHFMGLYHVFNEQEGNCQQDGDMIEDTPVQGSASSGCPTGKDSCPQQGVDSIHNYMDYSYDSCLTEFSPGQIKRMQMLWQFRAGSGSGSVTRPRPKPPVLMDYEHRL